MGIRQKLKTYFPEIWKRRDKNAGKHDYWFHKNPDQEKRRESILKLAIKETNPKIKK